ncbi:CinA family protein, partial [bacterium]|nr:CinA family protein [bacterium]
KEILNKFGSVSREVALSMAQGIKHIARTDIGLVTTGIAGPGGGSLLKPIGLVYVALVSNSREICEEYRFVGKREKIKEQVKNAALNLLRKELILKGGVV